MLTIFRRAQARPLRSVLPVVAVIAGMVALAAPAAAAGPYPPAASCAMSVTPQNPAPGQTVAVVGSGFSAGAPIDIDINSTPTTVARVTADSHGSFSTSFVVPQLANGTHEITAGPGCGGQLTIGSESTTTATSLASTGVRTGAIVGLGVLLLVAGSAVTLLARQRRRTSA